MKTTYFLMAGIIFTIFSCTSNKDASDDKINTDNVVSVDTSKIVNDIVTNFGFYFGDETSTLAKLFGGNNPRLEDAQYVKKFFERRDSITSKIEELPIENQYKNVNIKHGENKMKLDEFIKLCDGDANGQIVFIYGLKNKKLTLSVVGTKKITGNNFTIDQGTDLGADTVGFRNYGRYLKTKGISPFSKFDTYPFIFFDKAPLKLLLEKSYPGDSTRNKMIYFHYGFVRENNKIFQGVLFTTQKDLETSRKLDEVNYAAYNRNGTCCPPQY